MKKNSLLIVVVFLALIIGITSYGRQQEYKNRKALSIYVPCGMTIPFKELSMDYQAHNHDTKVETTFDNTNILVKLIIDKGKRPELFISPGKKEISLLQGKGLVEDSSIKALAKYELILIAPSKSGNIKELSDILKDSVRTIAIANPDFNSVGAYAQESLKSLGYWDKIQNKVIFTNTPIEALSYIATSKADAGIHYNICPFETNKDKVSQGAIKIISQLPAESHQPIHAYIGILKDSQNKTAAEKFIKLMFSEKGRKILRQYGLEEAIREESALAQKEIPKVVIEAYYPFNEEHIFMKDYLESFAGKYNGKVKVECIDFRDDEGYVRWRKTGLTCGGILINGKNKFKIDIDGQPKDIEFIKRMDMFWTKDELEAVVKQELEK